MYHATGFTRDEIVDLCALASAAEMESGINHWPPVLGLFRSVVRSVIDGSSKLTGGLLPLRD